MQRHIKANANGPGIHFGQKGGASEHGTCENKSSSCWLHKEYVEPIIITRQPRLVIM